MSKGPAFDVPREADAGFSARRSARVRSMPRVRFALMRRQSCHRVLDPVGAVILTDEAYVHIAPDRIHGSSERAKKIAPSA